MRNLAVLIIMLGITPAGAATTPEDWTRPGKGHFRFSDPEINPGRALDVYTYCPSLFSSASPLLFVMHGTGRNADQYRDQWVPIAERRGWFLIAPRFDREQYPEPGGYHLGNVASRWGVARATPEWSFSMIERLFDHTREKTGSDRERYLIYGHSAGGQFVHRFALFMPEARYSLALAANAGWYTFPDPDVAFPQGLRFVAEATETLRLTLPRPLVVMAGSEDNDPQHPQLRRDALVMFQGATRLERARSFFQAGRRQAERLGAPFGWRYVEVPGVAHSNRGMAAAAEPLLAAHLDSSPR